jgi:nucleotide-binding universal stress UspA family protein
LLLFFKKEALAYLKTGEASMSVRKFLLPLSSPASGEVALHTALLLTRMWNAHLQVLHIRTDTRDIAPLASEGMSGAMIGEMITAAEKESGVRARSLRELFVAACEEHDVQMSDASFGADWPSASFGSVAGREEEIIAHQARLSDLTVVPHPAAGEDVAAADALHAVLFDSGRPVLLSPMTRPVTIGKRIAVAWNGMSNSAAALGSAIPFIRQAEAVRVLTSPEYQRRGPGAAEVVGYIAHQGVTADIGSFTAIDREVGAGLLRAAEDFRADLMSMGAYSSSRLRELILGGVTRYVLENANLPVLMNR